MLKFSSLPTWVQATAIAAAGAVVPSLPGLLAEPPTVSVRDLARAALSAACAVCALWLHKPGAPKSDVPEGYALTRGVDGEYSLSKKVDGE